MHSERGVGASVDHRNMIAFHQQRACCYLLALPFERGHRPFQFLNPRLIHAAQGWVRLVLIFLIFSSSLAEHAELSLQLGADLCQFLALQLQLRQFFVLHARAVPELGYAHFQLFGFMQRSLQLSFQPSTL